MLFNVVLRHLVWPVTCDFFKNVLLIKRKSNLQCDFINLQIFLLKIAIALLFMFIEILLFAFRDSLMLINSLMEIVITTIWVWKYNFKFLKKTVYQQLKVSHWELADIKFLLRHENIFTKIGTTHFASFATSEKVCKKICNVS